MDVDVEILDIVIRIKCGVIDRFSYDLLLGVDFLRKTPFLLDFKNMILFNPQTPVCKIAFFTVFSKTPKTELRYTKIQS